MEALLCCSLSDGLLRRKSIMSLSGMQPEWFEWTDGAGDATRRGDVRGSAAKLAAAALRYTLQGAAEPWVPVAPLDG